LKKAAGLAVVDSDLSAELDVGNFRAVKVDAACHRRESNTNGSQRRRWGVRLNSSRFLTFPWRSPAAGVGLPQVIGGHGGIRSLLYLPSGADTLRKLPMR
jgi:hypothetical protein